MRMNKSICFAVILIFCAGNSFSGPSDPLLTQIRDYRISHEGEIISEFVQLLSIPNVSGDRVNIRRNAEFIREMMSKRGIEVQVLETPGNPVVYGEMKVPGAVRTLMFYAHYDGSRWIYPPGPEPIPSSLYYGPENWNPALQSLLRFRSRGKEPAITKTGGFMPAEPVMTGHRLLDC